MRLCSVVARLLLVSPLIAFSSSAAQVNVTTYHNDIARTGQNTQETILTPANVNSSQFGKLFTTPVDGYVYAQPLYLSGVSINGGTHNVLYIATEHDSLYAIDADSGVQYWQTSMIPSGGTSVSSSGFCTDIVPELGISGTPVIDPATKTIYLVSKTNESGNIVQRLHALDVGTHAEKFGGPKVISASVAGTGDGSSGTPSMVKFDPLLQNQRPALLLENGHVIIGWGSHCDITPYHGWLMSYSASTLAQEAVFNTDPNGEDSGIWMSGGGVAADASGNLFFSTGNGTYDGTAKNDYGDSILKLSPPSGGSFAVADWFTPFDQSSFDTSDLDVSSGGLVLLPALPNGNQYLALIGKIGTIYLVNRNSMGKFCSACTTMDTQIVQEIPNANVGVWGSPAFWNNTLYWGGGSNISGPDNIKAFSFNAGGSGLLSTSPTSKSSQVFSFSAPVPSVSANGTANGIVWGLDNSSYLSTCCQVLYAFNATNLGSTLYTSNQAANSRDVPGGAVKFTTPTIANGKVYVGSQSKISAYGLLGTTNPTAATPTFSPAAGTFSTAQSVTISDTTSGATIYYTTDGTTPTTGSTVYKNAIAVNTTTTLKAMAAATGYNNSGVMSGTYTITVVGTGINYGSGFSGTGMILNGSSAINGTRLRLTDGGANEAASAYYGTAQNVQSFTNDFSFQLANPTADGMTFIIQNAGTTAISLNGGGLGYGSSSPSNGVVGIGKSVAVKFDLFNSAGEGGNSTGEYTNGASPTIPAVTLGGGVNLHSGDVFNVHMTYDGTTLTMTITDASVPADTFTSSWTVNIPGAVGANSALIGFTAGTGSLTATQDIITWSFNPGTVTNPTAATPAFSPVAGTFSTAQSVTMSDSTSGATIYYTTDGTTPTTGSTVYKSAIAVNKTTTLKAMAAATGYNNSGVMSGTYTISSGAGINYGSGFSSTGMILNGSSAINGTRLRLTDGGANEAASAYYGTAQNVQSFTNDFSFQLANPTADGMTFIIQNAGTTAISLNGGGLGYGSSSPSNGVVGIGKSVAIKFDLFNSAGEGGNSTGEYTNGASPTIPAVTLGGGVNLHSGDVFNVHMTYDGTTLTMTITDASVPADTFTSSWTVNIPGAVGANTAWIGFTAATGSMTATQDIITWNYTH